MRRDYETQPEPMYVILPRVVRRRHATRGTRGLADGGITPTCATIVLQQAALLCVSFSFLSPFFPVSRTLLPQQWYGWSLMCGDTRQTKAKKTELVIGRADLFIPSVRWMCSC